MLGAFDPIPEIADLCSKYKLWLHVDAAWGGGALMSKKHRHLLEGIERYVYSYDLLKVTTSCIIHIIKKSLEIIYAFLLHMNYFS